MCSDRENEIPGIIREYCCLQTYYMDLWTYYSIIEMYKEQFRKGRISETNRTILYHALIKEDFISVDLTGGLIAQRF